MSAPNSSAGNTFEDLSGVATAAFSNPYDALISASEDDPIQMQARYTTHRNTRNSQQKAKMLDKEFSGPDIDPILLRLSDVTVEPGYVDPRHCLVFWGRPSDKVKNLISRVQQELLAVAPNLWVMPQDCLHITALEVTHSKKAEEIQQIVDSVGDKIPAITNFTFHHRARLIKPMIGFDASALALSFVPAAGEPSALGRTKQDDKYTYHHLRRDLYTLCQEIGVAVDSRYVVPSSHLTIGRFIKSSDFNDGKGTYDPQKMQAFIEKVEEINAWLEQEFWPEHNGGKVLPGADWIVGEEQGLNCRESLIKTHGYGGGDSLHQGKGF
ncbi:uncharacterized protein N0V89_010949 [Didymosphaeria variabile]|uniref:RNA ligase/cyclic nucleotide phosphodiesterase n=1 Tax=Didymosphaeria variabile TaxID=1932322 RepID=A0A9W9C5Z6_9PLEO|nr:uncharacterized protein N0V89_010949 [Didymosphaeria variabile]KAJ4347015.1 hypothetical protein N0V89_010949 [Didymosphaeria variabile]